MYSFVDHPGNPVPIDLDDRETAGGRDLILLANIVVRLEERRLRSELDLSYRQMRILKHIYGGVHSAKKLSQRFGVTAPAISETLESLVRRGYVTRESDPSDRRAVRLALTDEGAALYLRAQKLEDGLGRSILAALDVAELEIFVGFLQTLAPTALHELLGERRTKRIDSVDVDPTPS